MPRPTLVHGGRERDTRDGVHGPLPWRPPPEWRQFVEIMCALGHSQRHSRSPSAFHGLSPGLEQRAPVPQAVDTV